MLTAETLDGPWFYQRGVTSPYTINATVPQQFYWLVADDPMGDLAGFSYFAGIGIDPTLAATGYWHARPQPCAGQLRMVPIGTGAAGKSLAYVLPNVGCEVNFVITGGDSQSDSVPTGGIVSGFSSNATGMFVRCNGSAGSCDFKVWFVVGP